MKLRTVFPWALLIAAATVACGGVVECGPDEVCHHLDPAELPEVHEVEVAGANLQDGYAIEVVSATGAIDFTQEPYARIQNAARTWETILANTRLSHVRLPADFNCGRDDWTAADAHRVVDDLLVVAVIEPIDGIGKVLASAGPCATRRGGNRLPAVALLTVDEDDLRNDPTKIEGVTLHELGHALGIGTLWKNRIRNPSLPDHKGANTIFLGAGAIEAYKAAGGDYSADGVPVENRMGPGSGDSHWRESVFRRELMTPYYHPQHPISAVTLRSLQDLGYTVDLSLAEAYRVPR